MHIIILQELYGKRSSRIVRFLLWIWKNSFARLGEDWVYLALLGIIMALLSYIMDKGISMCTNGEYLIATKYLSVVRTDTVSVDQKMHLHYVSQR